MKSGWDPLWLTLAFKSAFTETAAKTPAGSPGRGRYHCSCYETGCDNEMCHTLGEEKQNTSLKDQAMLSMYLYEESHQLLLLHPKFHAYLKLSYTKLLSPLLVVLAAACKVAQQLSEHPCRTPLFRHINSSWCASVFRCSKPESVWAHWWGLFFRANALGLRGHMMMPVLPSWWENQSSFQLLISLRAQNSLQGLPSIWRDCTALCTRCVSTWAHAVHWKLISHILHLTNKLLLPCNIPNECMYKARISQSGNWQKEVWIVTLLHCKHQSTPGLFIFTGTNEALSDS